MYARKCVTSACATINARTCANIHARMYARRSIHVGIYACIWASKDASIYASTHVLNIPLSIPAANVYTLPKGLRKVFLKSLQTSASDAGSAQDVLGVILL